MNDLIERSKAVEAIYWEVTEVNSKEMAESVLRDVPTVDAEPVKHGHWTASQGLVESGEAQCSNCKTYYYAGDLYEVGETDENGIGQALMPNYCPHCGAKMDAEEETEVWNCSNGRKIIAPKGTFDKIYYGEIKDEYEDE